MPFFAGRVNMVRRQLGRNDKHVGTITAIRGTCVTLAEGIGGIRHGARPVQVDPAHLRAGSKMWLLNGLLQ